MTETIYNGFKRIDFEFEGQPALLVFPEKPNEDKNWMLKTEYFNAFPNFQIEMLHRGWHLAFIENKTRWCLEEDLDRKKRFVDYLSKEFGLYEKCVPVGMSCGGLIGRKFAAKYPECVSCLYLDAPVMNFLSCPAGLGVAENALYDEVYKATGITISQLLGELKKRIKCSIPIQSEPKIPFLTL